MVKVWFNVGDVVGPRAGVLCKGWAVEDVSLGGSS